MAELLAETVLNAQECKFEVGEDGIAGAAVDHGEDGDELAGARENVALFREFEAAAEIAGRLAELGKEAQNGGFDDLRRLLEGGIATRERHEAVGGGIDEEDFTDLGAVGFFEVNFAIRLAGENRPEPPEEFRECAGRWNGLSTSGRFGERSPDSGAQHGLEKFFGREIERRRGLWISSEQRRNGFAEVLVGEIRGFQGDDSGGDNGPGDGQLGDKRRSRAVDGNG